MNVETVLRYILSASNIYDGLVRISAVTSVSPICLGVVMASRTRCRAPLRKHRPYIGPTDLAIFRPMAIALQQFIGVEYGTLC
jgi:hypothetical protein